MPLSKVFNHTSLSSRWSRSARGLFLFFLTSLFLLTVSGFVFKFVFVAYNSSSIDEMLWSEITYALLWGLRFDLASAAIFSLLTSIILWPLYRTSEEKVSSSNGVALTLLFISLVVQMSFQVGDSIYYADAGRHVSYEMRDVMADASGLFFTAITYHAWFILYSAAPGLVVLFLSLRFARWFMSRTCNNERVSWKFNVQYEVSLFLIIFIAAICIRGGVTGLPQSVISAFKIGSSQQAVVTMNGAYSVIYGILNSSKEVRRLEITLPEGININEVMKELYPAVSFEKSNREGKKYNLIFVFLEGWPADMMASYGYDKKTTPFFDSLLEKSYAPLGVFASGLRTTEGLFATMCSQQNPLGETVAQSSLQNFSYRCLPEILKNKGWNTAFFQGTHKETSGTGAFAQSLGFTDSFAKEDMPAGRYERNFWGAHDPDIYDFVLDKLDEMPQPFLIALNTNSTHDIRVPPGTKPYFGDANSEQDHQSVLHFADQSMKEFFEKIKDKLYYKDTIFVLMSDHTGSKHNTVAEKYFIPGIIYSEDLIPAGRVDYFISQRDIAPTVLDILDLSPVSSFSGKSFYTSAEGKPGDEVYFSDYYDSGSIGWVSGHKIVETSISSPDVINCYSINTNNMATTSKKCDAQDKKLSEQSLVFTSYSQERLFKGETKQFYKFLNE